MFMAPEGYHANHKKIHRIYAEERRAVRRRKRR